MRWRFSTLSLLLLVGSILPLFAEGKLSETLKLGDEGEDVRELQQLLNREPATRIGTSGPGSPGNETTYFGPRTRDAVIRLQRLYASDILAPAGLAAPSGVVGLRTRLFLSQTAKGSEVSTVVPQTRHTSPRIISISPPLITKTTGEIVISGSGFASTGNTVVISSESPNAYINTPSPDGNTIRLTVRFSTINHLKTQLRAAVKAPISYENLVAAVSGNIIERVTASGNAHIPVFITVKNKGGTSAEYRQLVDITAMLLEKEN